MTYFVKKSQFIAHFCKICAIFAFILCAGCAKKPDPIDTIATSAHQQIAAIRESLTPECRTAANQKQLDAADATVDAVVAACDTQKEAINQEKLRYKWGFFGLLAVIGLAILAKLKRWF